MVKYLGPTVLDYLGIQHTTLLRSTTHCTHEPTPNPGVRIGNILLSYELPTYLFYLIL